MLDGYIFVFEYSYDNVKCLVGRCFLGDRVYSFVVDGVSCVMVIFGYVSEISYDDEGCIVWIEYVNGVCVEKGYDSWGYLSSL